MNEILELKCQVPHSDAARLNRSADIRTDLAKIAAREDLPFKTLCRMVEGSRRADGALLIPTGTYDMMKQHGAKFKEIIEQGRLAWEAEGK